MCLRVGKELWKSGRGSSAGGVDALVLEAVSWGVEGEVCLQSVFSTPRLLSGTQHQADLVSDTRVG